MTSNYISTSRYEIEAAAFRAIAKFVRETYGDFSDPCNQITGDEGIIIGIVTATENLLALKATEEQSE